MTTKLLHPRKQHVVEHVTDDIRALHQNDVELQKIMLTGRALKDVLSGDSVDSTDEYDAKYFVGGKFDFNKMLDPSIRYIKGGSGASTYTNGPLAGTANEKFCGAMLHTLTVLPEGKLSYEGSTDGVRNGVIPSIRQVFYPDDPLDLDAYTRVGNWNEDLNDYEWSGWISLSGRCLRILVKEDPDDPSRVPGILNNLLPYTIYELHCGGHEINLPSADSLCLATSIAFEQYANTNYRFTLVNRAEVSEPDPKQKYYFREGDETVGYTYTRAGDNGYIPAFETDKDYYTRDPISQWANTVNYTEKVREHTSGAIKDASYTTTLIPGIDTTRADTYDSGLEDGAIYEDAHEAILYRFEVINREEPIVLADGTTSRTWMLDAQSESIDALEGFSELLNAHTDMKTDDVVKYDKRGFRGGSEEGFTPQQVEAFDVDEAGGTLVITHPANMRGVAKITFAIKELPAEPGEDKPQLSNGFSMSIYKFNENDGEFDPKGVSLEFIESEDPYIGEHSPNPYKKYYTYNEASGYVLADGTGYPTAFAANIKYYTRVFIPTESLKVAKCRTSKDFGTSDDLPFRAAIIGESEERDVVVYSGETCKTIPRTVITGDARTVYMNVARNDVLMIVIKSDHHDNDKKLFSPTVEIYPDPHDSYIPSMHMNDGAFTIRDLNKLPFPCDPRQSVPSTGALIDAYEMMAGALQGKGLLYGRLAASSDLDDVVNPGIYTITSNSVANPVDKDTGASKHASSGTEFTNGTLVVYNTALTGTADARRSDEVTPTETSQVTQVIFGFRKQETGTIAPIGEIWWRMRLAGDTSWTPWTRLSTTQAISDEYTTDVDKADVERLLAAGQAVVVVRGYGETDVRTVRLPNPRRHKGAKMQVEAINCKVSITYTDPTSSSTPITYNGTNVKTDPDRMLYPLECDGEYWYVITVS